MWVRHGFHRLLNLLPRLTIIENALNYYYSAVVFYSHASFVPAVYWGPTPRFRTNFIRLNVIRPPHQPDTTTKLWAYSHTVQIKLAASIYARHSHLFVCHRDTFSPKPIRVPVIIINNGVYNTKYLKAILHHALLNYIIHCHILLYKHHLFLLNYIFI